VTLAEVDAQTSYSFTRKKDANEEIEGNIGGGETSISPARSDDDRSSSFQYAWKAKLKLIDEDFDDPDQLMVPLGGPNALRILGDKDTDVPMSLASQPSSPKGTQLFATDNVFSGSLSTHTGSQPHSASTFDESRSPTPDLGVVKRPKKRAVVYSDDDLAESSFDSPANMPHPINTPKLRSSPTPPTSDADLSAAKPQSKGKGKASVRGVPALVFDNDLEQSSETTHVKKNLQNGKRMDKESRPKIKVFII
jgi:mediator of replication checkpoint protein 1